jgi:prepilin-type N-terminal cleavage/methylation domain-containing protein
VKDRKAVGSWQFSVPSWQPAVAHRRQSTGFTLVELLVALALVGTIATMVYGSYAAASRSLDLYGSRAACYERTSLVLRLMMRQIRCAYLPPFPAAPTPSSPQSSTAPALPAVFRADSRDAAGTILSFITTAGPATGTDTPAGAARVMYRYDPFNGTLSVCCEPHSYTSDDAQEAGPWRSILSGVTRVDLQCYDGRQWQAAWTGESRRLPRAVKIGVTVLDEKGRPHEFEAAAPIGSRMALPQRTISTGDAKS